MVAKKLSIKKKGGKLVIHKQTQGGDEPEIETSGGEDNIMPFDPDPVALMGKRSINPNLKKFKDAFTGSTYKQTTPQGVLLWRKTKKGKWKLMKVPKDESIAVDVDEVGVKQANKNGKKVTGKVLIVSSDTGEILGVQEEETPVAEVISRDAPMANVGFGVQRAINMGNYESVKISVDIHVPSLCDEQEIEDNFEFARGWCEAKLDEIVSHYVDED